MQYTNTAKTMKTNRKSGKVEIYKANGITFQSFEEVAKYANENNYRISNSTAINHKGNIVHLIDLNSK